MSESTPVSPPASWDASQDAALDVSQDAALDVSQDAALDVSQDAALDTSQDAVLDAFQDEKAQREQLSSEFVDLNDDFYKFSQACAFLCDAFAAVAREPECITEDTSEGFGHVGYWLKCQLKDYREKIAKQQEYWCRFNRQQ